MVSKAIVGEQYSTMASSSFASSEAKVVAKGMPQVRWSREGTESLALDRSPGPPTPPASPSSRTLRPFSCTAWLVGGA